MHSCAWRIAQGFWQRAAWECTEWDNEHACVANTACSYPCFAHTVQGHSMRRVEMAWWEKTRDIVSEHDQNIEFWAPDIQRLPTKHLYMTSEGVHLVWARDKQPLYFLKLHCINQYTASTPSSHRLSFDTHTHPVHSTCLGSCKFPSCIYTQMLKTWKTLGKQSKNSSFWDIAELYLVGKLELDTFLIGIRRQSKKLKDWYSLSTKGEEKGTPKDQSKN